MIVLDEPKYPVQDPEPSFFKTMSNFKASDWALPPGLALVMWPIGFLAGTRNKIPHSAAGFGAYLGASAGFMLAYQRSFGRLAGLKAP
mmetsp:Transcript_10151/g.29181  ORF Transcript_10151/g.29181 Transcript_10151/m.29181 type:complete len:88 (+) Transcript_10151:187-450(+)